MASTRGQRYAVAQEDTFGEFLAECCPVRVSGSFPLPREVKLYLRSLKSKAEADFVLELADRTFGGHFTASYGPAGEEMAKEDENHPLWADFSLKQIADISCVATPEKVTTRLRRSGAVKVRRAFGRLWYSININRMIELTKKRTPKRVTQS